MKLHDVLDSSFIIIDTETTGLFFKKHYPFLLIAVNDRREVILHDIFPGEDLSFLAQRRLVFHNAKFDIKMLCEWGHFPKSRQFLDSLVIEDTHTMARLYYNREDINGVNYGLKKLYAKYIHGELGVGERVLKDYMAKHRLKSYIDVPDDIMSVYGIEDGLMTYDLFRFYTSGTGVYGRTEKEKALYQTEMRVIRMLIDIELRGCRFDMAEAQKWTGELTGRLINMAPDLPFNPESPVQVSEYLYGKLGMECQHFTPGGGKSTDGDAMESLQSRYPDVPLLQQLMIYKKLNGIVKKVKEMCRYTVDGRLYSLITSADTKTGRMASKQPNLQNLYRTGFVENNVEKYNVRHLIIADDDCDIVPIDLDQIEIKGFAYFSGDRKLQQALWDGLDAHEWTAKIMGGQTRRIGKTMNFGSIYGQGKALIAKLLGVSIEQAAAYQKIYHNALPSVRQFNQRAAQHVAINTSQRTMNVKSETYRLHGNMTENPYGRIGYLYRDFPFTCKKTERRRDRTYQPGDVMISSESYKLLNWLCQGTCADYFKSRILDCYYQFRDQIDLWLLVHDEAVYNIRRDRTDIMLEVQRVITKPDIFEGIVPITAEIGRACNHYYKE